MAGADINKMNITERNSDSGSEFFLEKEKSRKVAKSKQTKEDLLEALDNEDYEGMKEILANGTFKGGKWKEIRECWATLLNAKYVEILTNKLMEWKETRIISPDNKNEIEHWEQMQERLTSIIQIILIKRSKSSKQYESHIAFLMDIIPDITYKVAWDLQLENKRDETVKKEVFEERKKLGERYLQEYPFASKSIYHSINSKRFNEDLRVSFISALWEAASIRIQKEFKKNFEWKRILENVFFDLVFKSIYEILVPILKDLPEIYDLYTEHYIENLFQKSYMRKLAEKTKDSPKNTENEEKEVEITFMQDILNQELNPQQTELINNKISLFNLTEKEKKDLIKKITRLVKNQKPVKRSDYLWENGLIKVEDEGNFLDLVEDLGLKIMDEDKKIVPEEVNNDKEQKEEKTEIIIPLDSKEEVVLQTLSLDTSMDKLIQQIFENLEALNYTIINPKQLKKSFENFLTTGNNRESVLAALSNFNIMRKIHWKMGKAHAIKLSPKDRLLLIKGKDTREIDRFHDDHNAYQDRIDAIK